MKPDESPAVPLDSKISVTPSDGMSPRDSISTLLLADPIHRIGHLDVARKKPLSVKPTTSIAEAITLMMRHEFSQLPVMISTRKVKGIFSWRSLAQKIAFQKEPTKVEDAMEEAVIIDSNCSLFEAAKLVAEADCVLITDPDGTICGILTSYDLSVTFAERSEPFLLLEQIEKHVRNHLNQRLTVSELRAVRDRLDASKPINDASGLSFGDYVRILEKPELWKKINLPFDQAMFVKQLDEIRNVRNQLMHFNPNGIAVEDLQKLREFARWLQKIQDVIK